MIEDEPFLLKVYKRRFEKEGYQFLQGSTGADAIKLATQEQPSLIFLDLIMPDMNGFEVLQKLKADPGTAAIPVIILSNLGQEEDKKRCLELGAKDYLIKANTSLQEVVKRVAEIGLQ